MTKISCNVINDILPLYADEVVSEDTRVLVDEHLAECRECSQKLADLRRDIKADIEAEAIEAEKNAVVALKKRIRVKKIITVIMSVIAGAVIISAIIGCMKDADGYDGYWVVNATDPGQDLSNNVTVEFKKATKAIAYIQGEETEIELEDGKYTFSLAAGEGVFVIPIQ